MNMAVAREKPPSPIFVLRGCKEPVSSIAFLDDHFDDEENPIVLLASGTQEGNAFIWNLKMRSIQAKWKAHPSSILWEKSIASDALWTCGRNNAVKLWDLGTGSPTNVQEFPLHDYLGFSHCDVCIINNRVILCTPGPSQESVTIWDISSSAQICSLKPDNFKSYGSVMQCKWIKYKQCFQLFVIYESGSLVVWDWSNARVLDEIKFEDNPMSFTYDESLRKGLCTSASEKLYGFMFDEETNSLKQDCVFSVTNPGVGCITSRFDSKLYATGGWDNRIRIFSWKNHKPLAVLAYHKATIECIQFSRRPVETLTSGFLLAAGSSDNSISLWDIYNNHSKSK